MELIAFRNFWFVICKRTWHHDLIDHNPVVVDLSQAIGLFQIVETDFIVKRYVVTLAGSRDTNHNIFDARVAVDEADVVVEYEDINYQSEELHQECNEKANESGVLHPSIVVVKFEKISIFVLVCKVDHCNQEKVKHGT